MSGSTRGLEVPWRELSSDALRGVIVEYVTREGTEYGLEDVALETKVAEVEAQLARGEVLVLWDAESESVNLVTRRELTRARSGNLRDDD